MKQDHIQLVRTALNDCRNALLAALDGDLRSSADYLAVERAIVMAECALETIVND